jgi:hypothetical protein
MSPSQWFNGSNDEPSNYEKDTAKDEKAAAAAYKDSVKALTQGIVPNAQDVVNLKQLAAGSVSPEEQSVLKAAYTGQKLSPEQLQIMKQLVSKL